MGARLPLRTERDPSQWTQKREKVVTYRTHTSGHLQEINRPALLASQEPSGRPTLNGGTRAAWQKRLDFCERCHNKTLTNLTRQLSHSGA